MFIWHWIVHTLGVDYGVSYGKWIWYNFWSGVAGSFIVGMMTYLGLFYFHHTCHASASCWRLGKYPVAGGMFKVCHKHHPDMNGKKPHVELIRKLHEEHKRR